MAGSPRSLGYPFECVAQVPHDYECPICQMLLCEPLQIAKCGHRFCECCLLPVLREDPALCPLDRDEIERDKVFTDQACHRAILSLIVKCLNSEGGCNWTGELRDAKDHRPICPRQSIPCVNGCDCDFIPREEMDTHINTDCTLGLVRCTFSNVGCTTKVKQSDLSEHLEEAIKTHLDLTHQSLCDEKQRNQELVSTVEKYLKRVDNMEELLTQLARAPTKHEGKCLWRITNYSLRLAEAKSGVNDNLYSDPFYTGRYGYSMKCCVSLNGDGDAKGTHVTVYIIIIRGKFDALLPWPFRQKIKLYLMDQKEDYLNRKNIVMEIIPDVTLEGYMRPKEKRNPGVGIWKFASHESIQTEGFVSDDQIFIKCEVEPYDILSQN